MWRLVTFLFLFTLCACATVANEQSETRFILADPNKYKTEAEKVRALDLAQTACKAKAMTASAELEKSIAAELHTRDNVDRARKEAADMYRTMFALCMLNSGYARSS